MQAPNLHSFSDRRAKAKRRRQRDRANKRRRLSGRRRAAVKAVVVLVVLALFLALALLVGDSDYHATAIGWVPFIAAVTAVVLAYVHITVLRRNVSFKDVPVTNECERDSAVRFDVDFENSSILFCTGMTLYFYVTDMFGNVASETTTTMALAPREKMRFGFSTTFEHVGVYAAGLEKIVITDFLGLFEAEMQNPSSQRVRVLPAMRMVGGVRFSDQAVVEAMKASQSVIADSMDYAYVRDYEPGDPLKTIHWKLSARSDHYMTRLYEMPTNPSVAIVMDFYAASTEASQLMTMFDVVVESAFSLAQYARERGLDVALKFRDKDGITQRVEDFTRDKRARLVDAMPKMSNDPDDAGQAVDLVREEVASVHGMGNIILCSGSMDPRLLSSLVEAKQERREPLMVLAVPRDIIERERDAYMKPMARLDAADVPYVAISDSKELEGGRL